MQKNSENFSLQDIMRLANSPAGKQLISMLQQSDPATMQKAMEQASAGDYTKAKQALEPFINSDEVKKLMRQLGAKNG